MKRKLFTLNKVSGWSCLYIAAMVTGSLALAASGLPRTATASTASDPLAPVLDKMYNAEYAAAQQLVETWLKSHPDDFRAANYLAETVMDLEMVRENLFNGSVYMQAGEVFRKRTQPAPEAFQREMNSLLDRAQKLEEARLKQNARDVEALFWLGVTHASRTEFDFILLRSNFAALHEGKQALKDNERLIKLDPNFTDAYYVIGLANYTVGMLPWYIKWVTSLAGVHGSVSQGIADLVRVSREGHYERVDAHIVLVAIYERQKRYAEAMSLLRGLVSAYPENYLAPLEIARVQKAEGNWRAAARTYDSAVAKFVDGENDPGRIPQAEFLYLDGEAQEHSGQLRKALDLYHRAGKVPGKSMQSFRADLAAGRLDERFKNPSRAKEEYQIVARSVPDTDVGQQARQALESLR